MSSTSESALWYSNSTSMADASIRRESTELLKGLVWIFFSISFSLFVTGLVHLIKIICLA